MQSSGVNRKFRDYFDSIWYSSLQAKIAVASFIVGTVIVMVCLFCILPIGEIATSALQAAGMFLVLGGACCGVKVAFDLQSQKFAAQIDKVMDKLKDKPESSNPQPETDSMP